MEGSRYNSNCDLQSAMIRSGGSRAWTTAPNRCLTAVTDPGGCTARFACDGAGLLLSATNAIGQTIAFQYANGNLLSDGVRTYVWNARDQLVEIKQGTASIASFGYDPLGRRVSKTEGGQTISYLYDGLDAVQETQAGTVNPILTGLGIDERYARNEASGRAYFLSDALGSTRALINASGSLIQRYDYTPYGQTSQTNTGTSNPYQYTGRERDASGLYYYRARYYRPDLGRFVSEDPIGLVGGGNPYAYVHGSPLMYGDPLGLFDLPSIPQPVVNAVAGFGDSLSFGLTNYIRDQWDINGAVEKCSGYYSGGQVAGTVYSLAMPLSRLGYVAKARQIPRLGLSAEESVIARNALKNYFRGPFAYSLRNWHAVTYEGLVAQGKSSADIIAGAGRTSIGWTSVLVGGGLIGSATRAGRIGGNCGCGQ